MAKLSPVLLKVFVEVLEGTYRVGTIRYKLKSINLTNELVEYEFVSLDEPDESGHERSPLADL